MSGGGGYVLEPAHIHVLYSHSRPPPPPCTHTCSCSMYYLFCLLPTSPRHVTIFYELKYNNWHEKILLRTGQAEIMIDMRTSYWKQVRLKETRTHRLVVSAGVVCRGVGTRHVGRAVQQDVHLVQGVLGGAAIRVTPLQILRLALVPQLQGWNKQIGELEICKSSSYHMIASWS